MICEKGWVEEQMRAYINDDTRRSYGENLEYAYKHDIHTFSRWNSKDNAWVYHGYLSFYNSTTFYISIYPDGSGFSTHYDNNFELYGFTYFVLSDDEMRVLNDRMQLMNRELPQGFSKNLVPRQPEYHLSESFRFPKDNHVYDYCQNSVDIHDAYDFGLRLQPCVMQALVLFPNMQKVFENEMGYFISFKNRDEREAYQKECEERRKAPVIPMPELFVASVDPVDSVKLEIDVTPFMATSAPEDVPLQMKEASYDEISGKLKVLDDEKTRRVGWDITTEIADAMQILEMSNIPIGSKASRVIHDALNAYNKQLREKEDENEDKDAGLEQIKKDLGN